jgi:hypothetical protein
MKAHQGRLSRLFVIVAAGLLVAGCAAQTPFSPSNPSSDLSRHREPLGDPSTVIEIQNNWTGTINGSGSAECWAISSPLPTLAAGASSGSITLTFTPSVSCGIPNSLGIAYGPAAVSGNRCTFLTVYNASGFSYSVVQSGNTACKIEYPPNGLNAIFVYAQNSSPTHFRGSGDIHR